MSSVNTITITETFISPGDIICVPISSVKNNSAVTVTDATVSIPIPQGLEYVSDNLPQGALNAANDEWTVGILYPGQCIEGQICYRVIDIPNVDNKTGDCYAPYNFNISISASACESCLDNNSYCVVVRGLTCCEVGECVDARLENAILDCASIGTH